MTTTHRPEIQDIPLDKIIPTTDNTRTPPKLTDPALQELAASIAAEGLLQPVVVRPHPKKIGFFDLRAGCRRYLAHQINKAPTIRALVFPDMDDTGARTATALENLQRQDLTPLEQARGIQTLLASKLDVAEIARRLGKHVSWVYRRAKLASLSQKWLEAIEEFPFDRLSAKHLECVSRFKHSVQDRLLENFPRYELHGQFTVEDMDELTAKSTHLLKHAPWDLEDPKVLPQRGACSTCPDRRSQGNNCHLFSAQGRPEDVDCCLDPECWDAKTVRTSKSLFAAARERHPDAKIVADYMNDDEQDLLEQAVGKDRFTTIYTWQHKPCKAKAKGAQKILRPDRFGKPKVSYIQDARSRGSGGSAPAGAGKSDQPTPLKERREKLHGLRLAITLGDLLAALRKAPRPGGVDLKRLATFVAANGTSVTNWLSWGYNERDKLIEEWNEFTASGAVPFHDDYTSACDRGKARKDRQLCTEDVLWHAVRIDLANKINNDNGTESLKYETFGKQIARLIDFDWDTAFARACTEKPEPKSWAKLNEDGTPKKAGDKQKDKKPAAKKKGAGTKRRPTPKK